MIIKNRIQNKSTKITKILYNKITLRIKDKVVEIVAHKIGRFLIRVGEYCCNFKLRK